MTSKERERQTKINQKLLKLCEDGFFRESIGIRETAPAEPERKGESEPMGTIGAPHLSSTKDVTFTAKSQHSIDTKTDSRLPPSRFFAQRIKDRQELRVKKFGSNNEAGLLQSSYASKDHLA